MKKFLSTIIISIILITCLIIPSYANTEANQFRLKVENANENYDLYILLPKKYIKYAIQHDGLDTKYDGANTLIYNVIPSITVDISKIEKDTYIDDGIEYVQIKLDDLGGQEYVFETISDYTDMDMLYRIKSESRDNIMVIDNFTVSDNICQMVYDYNANIIQQKDRADVKLGFHLEWWQVILIIVLVLIFGLIYDRRRR